MFTLPAYTFVLDCHPPLASFDTDTNMNVFNTAIPIDSPLATATIGQRVVVFSAVVGLLYFVVTLVQRAIHESKLLPIAPSAPGLPIIGSLLEMREATRGRKEHLLFQKWAKELGSVYRVKVGLFTQYEHPRPSCDEI